MRIILAVLLAVTALTATSCDRKKGPAEQAGEKIDKAAEQGANAVATAGSQGADAVATAGSNVKDAVK
jgi:hypothetical protein